MFRPIYYEFSECDDCNGMKTKILCYTEDANGNKKVFEAIYSEEDIEVCRMKQEHYMHAMFNSVEDFRIAEESILA